MVLITYTLSSPLLNLLNSSCSKSSALRWRAGGGSGESIHQVAQHDFDCCCADTNIVIDGVIVWGNTSPISGRVKLRNSFQILDYL